MQARTRPASPRQPTSGNRVPSPGQPPPELWCIPRGEGKPSSGRRPLGIATGHDDQVIVRLWSLNTLEEVAALDCGGDVFGVRSSPNGRWLAAATMNGKVRL
jgi:hypothetical protein